MRQEFGEQGREVDETSREAMHHSIIAEVDKGRECVGLEWESTFAIPTANAEGIGEADQPAWPKGNTSSWVHVAARRLLPNSGHYIR